MPCRLTKYTPINAVVKISNIVLNEPLKLPISMKRLISMTGIKTNIMSNNMNKIAINVETLV